MFGLVSQLIFELLDLHFSLFFLEHGFFVLLLCVFFLGAFEGEVDFVVGGGSGVLLGYAEESSQLQILLLQLSQHHRLLRIRMRLLLHTQPYQLVKREHFLPQFTRQRIRFIPLSRYFHQLRFRLFEEKGFVLFALKLCLQRFVLLY